MTLSVSPVASGNPRSASRLPEAAIAGKPETIEPTLAEKDAAPSLALRFRKFFARAPRLPKSSRRPPIFLKFRSSVSFITFVVGWGIFVDLCIYGLAAPVIPFRLRELGYGDDVESLTGWLVAAYGGGLIVSSPFVGYFGEKLGGRRMPLLFSIAFMAGALVMFMLSKTVALLVVSRILQGFSGTAIFTLGFSLLADSVPEDKIALASGNAMIGLSLGGALGPPLGGVLYTKLGYYAPWIFAFCILLIDFVARLVVVEVHTAAAWAASIPSEKVIVEPATIEAAQEASSAPVAVTTRKNARGGPPTIKAFWMLLFNGRALTSVMMQISLGIFVGGLLDAGMTLRLNQRYGLNALQAGLVFLGNAIPALVTSPLSGIITDKKGPKWLAFICIIGLCPPLALLCINVLPLWAFIFILCFVGAFGAASVPPVSADLTALVRETEGLGFSHVFSVLNLAYSIGSFIGPLMVGQLLEALGIERGWYAAIGINIGFFLLCLPMIVLKYPNTAAYKASVDSVQ